MNLRIFDTNSETKSIEDPGLPEIRSGLVTVLGSKDRKVRLQKSASEWLEASWSPNIGLQLRCHEDGNQYSDATPYLQPRSAIRILRSYGRGFDGWSNMIRWVPDAKSVSVKELIRRFNELSDRITIPLSLPFLVIPIAAFVSLALRKGGHEELSELALLPFEFLQYWYISGPYLVIVGLVWTFDRSVQYAYRSDLESHSIDDTRWFYSSIVILLIGILLILAQPKGA